MTAPTFQYQVYHPVNRRRIGQLSVREPKWTEVVNGGTTFTGKVTVPDNPLSTQRIKDCTIPYGTALYAVSADNSISFGGPLVNRDWDDSTNTLAITAIDWKSWFYRTILGPTLGTDPLTDTFTNTDQLTIASRMVTRATWNDSAPYMESGEYVSGVNRNYIITGIAFRSLGAWLDDLGGLANGGFEWEVEPYFYDDGLPLVRVQYYIPQRGGVVPGLVFTKTPEGGNILRVEEMQDDATGVASRVWAVGEGPNAESTPWAGDQGPVGLSLLTDQVTQYSGALTRSQLASYARTERLYRSEFLSGLSFRVRMDNPSIFSYTKGDRCRVRVKDRFLDIDVSNCRILSREMDPDTNTVKLTVNLKDLTIPEVDTGGAV